MNERIRELAKEALVEHCVSHVRLEDFAQRIIRECIDIVSKVPNGYRDYRNQIEDAMRADCLQAIQEHFGVEDE